jgi:hypothetical protein
VNSQDKSSAHGHPTISSPNFYYTWKVLSYSATDDPFRVWIGTFLTFPHENTPVFGGVEWGNFPEWRQILRYLSEPQLETKKS